MHHPTYEPALARPMPQMRPRAARRSRTAEHRRFSILVLAFLAAHVPLGLVMKLHPLIPTAHALATLGLGVLWIFRSKTADRMIPVLGYIVGAEVLWRGTKALIFWEYGKYTVALLAVLAILRFRRFGRTTKVPMIYFLLLLPSIAVMPYFDRGMVAFNLSGPFALATTTMLFSTERLTPETFKRLLIATLAPILGLAVLATVSTLTTEVIQFGASTRATSGGIGPNQVSSVLGLGALLAFFYAFVDREHVSVRWTLMIAGLWLGGQSALTFSRGGLATSFGALAAGSFFLLQDRRFRGAFLLRGALVGLASMYLLYPMLDSFTDGALSRRFSSTSVTGRDKLIQGDLLAFREHPMLGVGPGQSKAYHQLVFRWSATHTEYTRLLAEHGSAGLLALMLMLGLAARRLKTRASPLSRSFSATLTVWALLYMLHSAMRLAAPAMAFGLGAAILLSEGQRAGPRRPRPARPPMLTPPPRAPAPDWRQLPAAATHRRQRLR